RVLRHDLSRLEYRRAHGPAAARTARLPYRVCVWCRFQPLCARPAGHLRLGRATRRGNGAGPGLL
ncbi:hypothetical protein IWQ60_000104, partial [Tieghemiomyces parasiticus]